MVEGSLMAQMQSAGYDCTTAPLMRRLRALLDAEATDYAEVGMRFHSLARGLIFSPNWGAELLWASPGMTELLTTGDNLYSLAVQKRAAIGFRDGLPSDDCVPVRPIAALRHAVSLGLPHPRPPLPPHHLVFCLPAKPHGESV